MDIKITQFTIQTISLRVKFVDLNVKEVLGLKRKRMLVRYFLLNGAGKCLVN